MHFSQQNNACAHHTCTPKRMCVDVARTACMRRMMAGDSTRRGLPWGVPLAMSSPAVHVRYSACSTLHPAGCGHHITYEISTSVACMRLLPHPFPQHSQLCSQGACGFWWFLFQAVSGGFSPSRSPDDMEDTEASGSPGVFMLER